MKAYKGTNKTMMCRDFQYELGKEYTYEGEIELCKSGFHACLNPIDCLNYYPCDGENRFFEVEIDGVFGERGNNSKAVARSIKFVREITGVNELLDGAEYIPNWAFYRFQSLTSVGIKGSGASVEIPDSVTSIGYRAFQSCSGLTSATIGNSITSIGGGAFYNCSGLTSITIPNSVTSIGYCAFDGCTSLTSVTIGNSVTSIGSSAFGGCSKLTNLVYADGCTTALRTYATYITSVTIPDSVTIISRYAFCYCSKLTSITYAGTIEQWNSIIKGTSWNYNIPISCMVHCTDGDIKIC